MRYNIISTLCKAFFGFLIFSLVTSKAFAKTDPEIRESKKCSNMFAYFERKYHLPKNILHSISLRETRKPHSERNLSLVWPWTVNIKGKGYHFDDQSSAIEFVQSQIALGVKNIDVGCMQINLKYHPNAFESVEHAFSPRRNIAYGAKFLKLNYDKLGNWDQAIGRYHSSSIAKAKKYNKSVNHINANLLIYKNNMKNIIAENYVKSRSRSKFLGISKIQFNAKKY